MNAYLLNEQQLICHALYPNSMRFNRYQSSKSTNEEGTFTSTFNRKLQFYACCAIIWPLSSDYFCDHATLLHMILSLHVMHPL